MPRSLIPRSADALSADARRRQRSVEKAIASRLNAGGVVSANLAADTAVPNAWTDLVSITISPQVPVTVRLDGRVKVTSTAAGGPKMWIGLFEGATLIGLLGVQDVQGTTVATQPIQNVPLTITESIANVRGSHTYTLRACKDTNGTVTATASETTVGVTGPVTKLTATLT